MIGIIGAMDEEVRLLKEHMTITEEVQVANCDFTVGKLMDVPIVLLKSGIGKVNAALATTILLERFDIKAVINTGSAGGLDTTLSVGDIVIGREVVHHDVDVRAFDYDYGQVPGMPKRYLADHLLIDAVEQAIEERNEVHSKQGLIATGDSFMQHADQVNGVLEHLPDTMAVEMEAAAIAQVCYQYEVPCVVIRSLSDIAGKASNVSFDQYLDQAAKHAAELIMRVVTKIA
ncbi:5'-methylthioadenosine/S-adenosylhomocysteine nucleosidase [Halolactibacillus miurensis]|uniref:5'-methylthioadenosine/S-adenosylhomocysteine nucleosidase n=1 Tax=Halolactibacillus miurensis TaxID=306541 RepID=A0A1I6PMS5_9BACI|nr:MULTISPECIES: 5'-methylthioadenosine/S-adenosylhomocysteine nucleosidase [Halolactibacillus]GEM03742.1 5'-methylthioadenosine/S-adenosylhomocysteine nucleosidase [Halolactibacillus miurensis]SFS41486.1 adenosylhomocysteine nucleosidase [Halolactibacillus miurensis]